MFHVVVCSNCKYVWIVEGRPKTSQCGKCRKTRKFDLLKKYHKTENREEAKLARAFYHAQVKDQGEHFERALDRGVLEEDLDAFLTENEYLEMQGVDSETVEGVVENLLSSPEESKSEIQIIRDAFNDLEEPTFDEFLEYAEKNDLEEENAVLKLDGLVRSGVISDTGNITVSQIESQLDMLYEEAQLGSQPSENTETEESTPKKNQSHREILLEATARHGDGSIEDILEYAEARGINRQKAVIQVEKLVLSGQISLEIDMEDISSVRIDLLGDDDIHVASTESGSSEARVEDKKSSALSQKEIMVRAIEEQTNPNENDVLDYAANHGLRKDKAERLLRKMKQHGEVIEKPNHTIHRI